MKGISSSPEEMLQSILKTFGIRARPVRTCRRVKCVKCGRPRKRGERWSVVCDQCRSQDGQ